MKYLAIAALASLTLSAQDRAVPIDNDQVKVLNVTQGPHIKTKLHKHDMNRVMIYLQPGKQTIEYQGAKTAHLNWKAGEALWSPAGGMHIAEITSDNKVTIVELELKKPGVKSPVKQPALDPVKIDPKHYKVELENDQVRVVRVTFGGKQGAPMHEHTLNRVVVYLTDQDFRITSPEGKVDTVQHKAGDVSWGVATKHKEDNVSDKKCELLVVELKN